LPEAIPGGPNREGAISGGVQSIDKGADRFSQAYHELRADPAVQFNLAPPPAPPKPPPWLAHFLNWLGDTVKPVGRFLRWIVNFFPDAAYARILLWTVIAVGAAALLWAIYSRIRYGQWRFKLPRLTSAEMPEAEDEWVPEEAGARSWLEEADALAREGRFAEAIHHLLFRSIEDISRRRAALVRPALTSRELAASEGIPGTARNLFAAIAGLVERNLFGGHPVGQPDWAEARKAYSDFALPAAWRG
jgi:hypothetical protein